MLSCQRGHSGTLIITNLDQIEQNRVSNNFPHYKCANLLCQLLRSVLLAFHDKVCYAGCLLLWLQVCKAGMTVGQSRKIWLTRHGESEWNMLGKIGGDSAISARGEEYARLVPDVLEQRLPAVSSPLCMHITLHGLHCHTCLLTPVLLV